MAEQPLQDSEVARLLKDYSLSIQEDIRSRLPPGVLTWVPPSLTASTPKTGFSPGSGIEGSSFFEDITQHRNPRYLKALCLLVILLIEFGSHYSENAVSTLKASIKQYGIIQSSGSVVGMILPFFGGLLLDNSGTQYGCLLATSLLALGSLLIASSLLIREFYLIILGKIVYSLGTCLFVLIRGFMFSQWFECSSLPLALGIVSLVSRLAAFLAMATPYPLASLTGYEGAALWIPVIAGVVVVLFQLGFVHVGKTSQPTGLVQEPITFRFSRLLYLPLQLWCIILVYSSLGAGSSAFLHFQTEMLQLRFGFSSTTSGAFASLSQFFPLLLSPLLVFYQNDFGGDLYLVSLSSVSFTLAMVLLGFSSCPLIGMAFFSLSLLLGSVSLSALLPTLVSEEGLGTALGLSSSAFHVSLGVQDLILGHLQAQNSLPKPQVYRSTMVFMVLLGFVAILLSLLVFVLDRVYGESMLNSSASDRNKLLLARARSPDSFGPITRCYMRTRLGNQMAIGLLLMGGLSYFVLFYYSF